MRQIRVDNCEIKIEGTEEEIDDDDGAIDDAANEAIMIASARGAAVGEAAYSRDEGIAAGKALHVSGRNALDTRVVQDLLDDARAEEAPIVADAALAPPIPVGGAEVVPGVEPHEAIARPGRVRQVPFDAVGEECHTVAARSARWRVELVVGIERSKLAKGAHPVLKW